MKKIITTLLFFSFFYTSNAQVTFLKSYDGSQDEFKCFVIKTNDGGYAMVGASSMFGAGNKDIYVVRTNNQGNILWTKTYGGAYPELGYGIQQTADGGFVIIGATGSFNTNSDINYDVYMVRTDMNGDTLWTRKYGQEGTSELGWVVQQTADGGFIIGGQWGSSTHGYLIRTNSSGDTLWTRINDGGIAGSIVQTSNKGFLIGGTIYSSTSGGDDMFLYQIDSSGNVQWFHTYGGSNSDFGQDVHKANDGGFIIVGYTNSFGAGDYDMYVVKTDSIGQLQWSKTYGTSHYEEGLLLTPLKDGSGYALLGRFSISGSYFTTELLTIDNSGNINWVKDYYGADILTVNSLQQTDDNGFIFSGFKNYWFLTKTDNLGNSGCNDSTNHLLIVNTPATQVGNFTPSLSQGTAVGSTKTIVGSGGTATTICLTTGIENIHAPQSNLSVYPNPCTDCEIKGVERAKDIMVTDIMGRSIPVTLTKSTDGYTLNLGGAGNGIYIIRNIKTGEVKKIVHEI